MSTHQQSSGSGHEQAGDLAVPVTGADHQLGAADAPLTLVEYADYQCPYCAQAVPIVEALRSEFGDRLRFVYRNLPLRNIHPHAQHAAQAAEAAALQGRFWEMHDLLFANQVDLTDAAIFRYADSLELDSARFATDVESEGVLERIQADLQGAVDSGVGGTPTFFINGRRHDGAWGAPDLAAALNASLT